MKAWTREERERLRKWWFGQWALFRLSGQTGDSSIRGSRILPEPDELEVREDDLFTSIVRKARPRDGEEATIIASMKRSRRPDGERLEGDSSWHAHNAVIAYASMNRPQRAEVLEIDDPLDMPQRELERLALASTAREAGGSSTVVRVVEPGGISRSVEGSPVKRISWNGHSGFSLARWMGSVGYSATDAKAVFKALGMDLGESAIVGGVSAGKAGKRGAPAAVTVDQARYLESLRPNPLPLPAKVEPTALPPAPKAVAPPVPSKAERKRQAEFTAMKAAQTKPKSKGRKGGK